MSEQELLAQLRDVRLPAEPGWWPPAIGWWLLAGLLVAVIVAVALWWRRWRAEGWRRAALQEHHRLQTAEVSADTVRSLSVLMRRVALHVEPRRHVASATDQQWLDTLDRIGNTREYREGVGGLLIVWPYRNLTTLPADEVASLFALTRRTIKNAVVTGVGHAGVGGADVVADGAVAVAGGAADSKAAGEPHNGQRGERRV